MLGDSAYVWEQGAEVRFSGEGINPEVSIFRVGKTYGAITVVILSQSERLSNIPSDRLVILL